LKDLNLVPKSYILKKKKRKAMVFYSIFSVAIVAAVIVIVLMPVFKIQSLKSRMAFLDLNEKEVSKYISVEREFNVLKNMYLQRENEAKRLLVSGIDLLEIIEKLEGHLPERIFLKSLVAQKGGNNQIEITIRGIADSEEEIATFSRYISEDDYFSSIKIKSISSKFTADGGKNDKKENHAGNEQKENEAHYSFDAVIYLTAGK